MNTEEKKYKLAICSYVYNDGMPDLNKGSNLIKCTKCGEEDFKVNSFWVNGLVTCPDCFADVAKREAKEL